MDITILANPSEIWNAISTAKGLAQWFSPIAEGGGALGLELLCSWNEELNWHMHTTAWEENEHLQWSDSRKNGPGDRTGPIPVAIDWYIERITGGRCVVHLVQSEFPFDPDRNDQYVATNEGWTYFLFNLRHYLERHAGKTRSAISERRLATIPRSELWTRLLGPAALRATTNGTKGVRVGDRLSFTMERGRSIPFVVGRVEANILWGTAETLNDGLLLIELEPGASEYHFGVRLSVYDLPRRDIDSLREWIQRVVEGANA